MKSCSSPDCPNLTSRFERFCPTCTAKRAIEYGKKRDRKRLSSRQRGYDARWDKFRKLYLVEMIRLGYWRCAECMEEFRGSDGVQVDHIKPLKTNPELKYDKSNLQLLCRRCHFNKSNMGE